MFYRDGDHMFRTDFINNHGDEPIRVFPNKVYRSDADTHVDLNDAERWFDNEKANVCPKSVAVVTSELDPLGRDSWGRRMVTASSASSEPESAR
ncbi:hypothetical protein [Trinickia mobilis]|uniref:hypothetical protein n=1 Tax=Trinickia mobilis TaxID=2816356 RepID=UPI001A8CCC59|nr:hypothetical protein [Trinickia mobilis]